MFQNHLLSVFDNTRLVTFDEKVYDKILAINSQEGERVELDEPVNAQVRLKLMCTSWQSCGIHHQCLLVFSCNLSVNPSSGMVIVFFVCVYVSGF